MRRALPLALLLLAGAPAAAGAGEVGAGAALSGEVSTDPVRIAFTGPGGRAVLTHRPGTLRIRVGGTWVADPEGRRVRLSLARAGEGALRLTVAARDPGVEALAVGFGAVRGERFLGFGERSNAVDQRGGTVLNRVEEGPYVAGDYPVIRASVPPWGLRQAPDATYFPIPWLLSTRGHGVLVENDETSRFDLRGRHAWTVEVEAPRLVLTVFAGPTPARALRRMTAATGRQPPAAAPWQWGAWFQTGHENEVPGEQRYADILRDADAPVSAVETHMRYMPCSADRGREAAERARTAAFHAQGLAALTYTREAVCRDAGADFTRGIVNDAFVRRPDGSAYTYPAFVGGRTTDVAQIDPTARSGPGLYASIVGRAVANGYDGWMEDYGEYTPPDAVSARGGRGDALHNRYPVLYHRMAHDFARAQPRPLVRFQRSGWTGAAREAQIVWGGDPSTAWGFDGLASAVRNGLTMGLSGISTWGSDIGGFFTFTGERLTPELLARWIQFGAVSGVMRTKAEGIGPEQAERPQVWERPTLAIWRRYAKLRTQLYPYLVAADAAYRRTGLPIMRHLALADPGDARAAGREDEFLFGPDLLAAPVLAPRARSRRAYLPAGTWIDLWRALRYDNRSGGLEPRAAARPLRGGRAVTVPAPLDELPLFARAGALLALLPADVDTLADHGTRGGLVKLRDRADRMTVLAFPRARSSARFGETGRLSSAASGHRWVLSVADRTARRYDVVASLGALEETFVPCAVRGASAWRYDRATRTLRATVRGERARLVVRGHC